MNIAYYNAGSGNHGCEAILKSLCSIITIDQLYSFKAKEDIKWNVPIKEIRQSHWGKTVELNPTYEKGDIALSIGGDNYCAFGEQLSMYNNVFNSTGCKTALIGCSIDDEIFDNPLAIEDLKRFSLITARESITYLNLIKHGIEAHLIPDSAFILETGKVELQGDYIGINGSNIVDNDLTYKNYVELIKHILNNTKYKILLIPHVVQEYNNDIEFLTRLKNEFDDYRVEMLEETDCITLKGYISQCKAIICSRTHCSIASYSSCVPTLVMGYSTKSKGIAKDIGQLDHVLDYRTLETEFDLVNKFKEMDFKKIKKDLQEIMPEYKKRCYEVKELIENDIWSKT